jgi:hypothetical protein
METAVIKESGILYSDGEVTSMYKAGDKVKVVKKLDEDTYEVVILKGNSKGMTAYFNKYMLIFE